MDEDSVTFLVEDQTTDIQSHSTGEVQLGQVEPGQAIDKTVYLYGSRISGSRLITLTVSGGMTLYSFKLTFFSFASYRHVTALWEMWMLWPRKLNPSGFPLSHHLIQALKYVPITNYQPQKLISSYPARFARRNGL